MPFLGCKTRFTITWNQQYVFNPYVRAWECPLLLCSSPFLSLLRSFSTHNLRWVRCEIIFEMMDFDDESHWLVCLKSGCGKHYEQRNNVLLHWKLASARRQGRRDNKDSWWNFLIYEIDEIFLSTKLMESPYYKLDGIILSTK